MRRPRGSANQLYIYLFAGLAILGVLGYFLYSGVGSRGTSGPRSGGSLVFFCAAGMRYPMEDIVKSYRDEYGVDVQVQYAGSNTLLSPIVVNRTGDLYLAADVSYIAEAKKQGLSDEVFPLAHMKPVIVVKKDNESIKSIDDLLSADVRVALGNPEAAAVGRKTRKGLSKSGHWERLNKHVTAIGVFKPTVNEIANDVKIGSVTAGIVWDSTVAQYPDLKAIPVPELDAAQSQIQLTVLSCSEKPTRAIHFARYVAAHDRGLNVFKGKGFDVVEGDKWADKPEVTFFAGSVNRRALEPIINAFEAREGVQINTVYNGCGILTAQMKSMKRDQGVGFPDFYMACDVYYLETVQDWFREGVNVSDVNIVIAVPKGNPKGIRTLQDLAKPGMRVALGQPEQCTIGVLTRRLLEDAGLREKLVEQRNIVTETQTSALLVPTVTTNAADAALVYESDTIAEKDKVDAIVIDSPLAKAVQPFSVAESSEFKRMGQRMFVAIGDSRDKFEAAGFRWRLPKSPDQPAK